MAYQDREAVTQTITQQFSKIKVLVTGHITTKSCFENKNPFLLCAEFDVWFADWQQPADQHGAHEVDVAA